MKREQDTSDAARNSGVRRFLALLLISTGVVCLVYGVGFHRVPVVEEAEWTEEELKALEEDTEDTETEIELDDLIFHTDTEEGTAIVRLREPDLLLEVSRGGVEREAPGTLRKTYSGKPPQACPT